jgi:hypothetical protein
VYGFSEVKITAIPIKTKERNDPINRIVNTEPKITSLFSGSFTNSLVIIVSSPNVASVENSPAKLMA